MKIQKSQDIYLTDFANPVLSEAEKQTVVSAPPVTMSEEAVLGAAQAATGLSDFGPEDFRERLGVWLRSFDEDKGLGPLGRKMAFDHMVRSASNRLKVEDIVKRHPEILEVEMPKPIIVSGLPRSGTTHLVNLLSNHPDLRSMPLWEAAEVVPAPDEMTWESSEANPRYRRCYDVWRIYNNIMVYWSLMHDQTPGYVTEEGDLQCFDFSSYFPDWMARMRPWQQYYFNHDQTPHYAYSRKVMQVMTWLHGPNRWVMKSPQNMENLPAIFNVYPDATVVITHRDPISVLQSAITLMAYADRIRRTDMDLSDLVEYWVDRIERLLRICVRDRDTLPQDQIMDVMFHDYMADERGTVAKVCEMNELNLSAEAERRMGQYLEGNPRGKHGRVIYDLIGNFGVDIAALRRRFQFYYDRLPVRQEPVLGE
jgi:hypothetical protein